MSEIVFYYTLILTSITKHWLTKAEEQLAPWIQEKNVLRTVQECLMHFTRVLFYNFKATSKRDNCYLCWKRGSLEYWKETKCDHVREPCCSPHMTVTYPLWFKDLRLWFSWLTGHNPILESTSIHLARWANMLLMKMHSILLLIT